MNLKIVGIVAGMLLLAGCSNDEKVFELQGNAEGVKTFTSFTATLDDVAGTRAYLDAIRLRSLVKRHLVIFFMQY